jgi:hypothetical protein
MSYREIRKGLKEDSKRRLSESIDSASFNNLSRTAKKRFQTVFVGAVAAIEKHFGPLWGEEDDVDEEDMTPEQLQWYNRFLVIREHIFDQGNNQREKFLKDLSRFKVKHNSIIMQNKEDKDTQNYDR